MARGNAFTNHRVALGNRLEGNRPSGATPEEIGIQQGVPFLTDRLTTTHLYLRMKDLEIRPPRHFRMEFLRNLPVWGTLRGYLNTLGLSTLVSRQWEGHNSLCMEMCCSFRLELNAGGELCMFASFNSVMCEITRELMHEVFGFHTGEDLSEFVPVNFDVSAAWYELSGVANYKASGVPSAFIRDDALLVLHRFLSCMVTAKKEHNKVNAVEIYLLTCARDGKRVCLAPFIWGQLSNVQTKRGAHPTLAYIATGLAPRFDVDLAQCEGLTPSQEITPAEFIRGHLMITPTEFTPVNERPSVKAYYRDLQQRGIFHEEAQAREGGGGDDEEQPEQQEEQHEEHHEVPADDELLVRHYHRRDRIRARQAMEAEIPPYWADFQQGMFARFDSMSTQMAGLSDQMTGLSTHVSGLDRRVSNIEGHLMHYTDFSIGSTSAPPHPDDPRYWSPHDPRWQDPRFGGPFN